jgi:hypothetical protein
MDKSILSMGVLAFAALQWPEPQVRPCAQLKEEAMVLEYTVTAGEAVVLLEAEAEEALSRIEIRTPRGDPILRLRAEDGRRIALQGFVLETAESELGELFANYPEGIYDIRAGTVDGQDLLGSAELSHELLAPPVVLYPYEGALDVPHDDLVVNWIRDPEARGYRVILEQGESDGLSVLLGPEADSFRVPDGVLRPHMRTLVEVGAIGPNRNCTLVEVLFRTL